MFKNLLFIIFLFISMIGFSQDKNDLLLNVQDKIMAAFGQSFIGKNNQPLSSFQQQLYKERQKNPDNANLINYWLSYCDYYQGIFYTAVLKDAELSKMYNEQCMKRLDDTLLKRSSEDHSLLGLAENFSIQFISNPIKIGMLTKKIETRCEKAIEMDIANPRPYFVLGELDYYTPKMFGGQSKCEKLFLKVIAMPEQKIKNAYMPSWGKERAYELLIQYYLNLKDDKNKAANKMKAKEMYKKGMSDYPNSYNIKQLADQLID